MSIDHDRFKVATRAVHRWPPEEPGYEHLLTIPRGDYETAYYCRVEDAKNITDILCRNIEKAEGMLQRGATLEEVLQELAAEPAPA